MHIRQKQKPHGQGGAKENKSHSICICNDIRKVIQDLYDISELRSTLIKRLLDVPVYTPEQAAFNERVILLSLIEDMLLSQAPIIQKKAVLAFYYLSIITLEETDRLIQHLELKEGEHAEH